MQDVERSYQPLTAEEEKAYFELIKRGNHKARIKIYNSMLKFVVKVAFKYKNNNVDLEDLIQEGNFALDKAIDNFDTSKNLRFMTYAVGWIKSAINEKIADLNYYAEITGAENQLKYKCAKTVRKLEQKRHRTPTIEEISNENNMPVKKLKQLVKLDSCCSLDAEIKIKTDKKNSLLDVIPSADIEEPYELKDLKEKINDFLKTSSLNNTDKKIIRLHHGFETGTALTFQAIGDMLAVSKQAVSIAYTRSVKMLARYNEAKKLGNKFHLTPDFTTI
jgi:RNA polymerase primary sigma factor